MDFTKRKLPPEVAPYLRLCPIESVAPYSLMVAPIYIHLAKNFKYLAVKAPLDYFTQDELAHYKPYKSFFVPPNADASLRFRDAGRQIRALLHWEPKQAPGEPVRLPPAPFEISDAMLRILGPLFGGNGQVEAFFVAVLANEICDPLPPSAISAGRESGVLRFESAICRSAWFVVLALLLGNFELRYLSQSRRAVFDLGMGQVPEAEALGPEVSELVSLVLELKIDSGESKVSRDWFEAQGTILGRKVAARIQRSITELADPSFEQPSVRGEGGFIDVG
jgi:hypothetical protein